MIWVWSGNPTLTGAFTEAHKWSMQVLGRVALTTYQGMLKALLSWGKTLLPLIGKQFHSLMNKHGGRHWRVGRWMALAVDGSRISVPRTAENEKAFCAPNYGKSSTAKYRRKKRQGKPRRLKHKKKMQPVKPQIWMTLLWHMGLHMPWSWKTGPSYSCERDHFRAMLKEEKFPENTLFCADAGFTGYDLWKAMIDSGHSFLIRVGSNVKLLRNLGYVQEHQGIVYLWPASAVDKEQPPLVLRLLKLQVGRCTMWLVSNVLEEKHLSDQDATRLYKLRWGVELQFCTIKQTFGRRKLKRRTPENALVELDMAMLGLWLIQLFAVKEQIEIGKVPEQCSVSIAIQVVREMIQRWSETPEESFVQTLQGATKDTYKRISSKKARYRPDYKDKPSAGKPKILKATRELKAKVKKLLSNAA